MRAVYYRGPGGTQPVREFIDGLVPEAQAVLETQIDRLNMLGVTDPPLPFPHSSQVSGELRELRCHHGRQLYRVFYRRSRDMFVLLHVIRKTSSKLPSEDIEVADRRWVDFKSWMDATSRQPPRRAGRGAP